MATFYGSDTTCLYDVPLIDLQITDPVQLIGQRIARRLQTPRGALAQISDDPDFGWDVRQYLQGKFAASDLDVARREIAAEILKDEEVQTASVTVTLFNAVLSIVMLVRTAAGPFTLTLNVTQLTTELIFAS